MRRPPSILLAILLAVGTLGLRSGVLAQECTPFWSDNEDLAGVNSTVESLLVAPVSGRLNLYVGGRFNRVGDLAVGKIAAWDGRRWSAMDGGVGGVAAAVYAMTVYGDAGDPRLIAAGSFTTAGGVSVGNLAAWDGGSWMNLGTGASGPVFAVATFDDGAGNALYIGGAFTSAGTSDAAFIAKWDGAVWSRVGDGVDGRVLALVVHDDGDGPALYAAGDFSTAGSTPANHVARWDGTEWSAVGDGLSGSVYAMASERGDGDGEPRLYAGGRFSGLKETGTVVAVWNGQSWHSVGSAEVGTVRSLGLFDNGGGDGMSLYAGGTFTSIDSVAARNIARWTGESWHALGEGLNDTVVAIAASDEPSAVGPALYAGGRFTATGPQTTPYLAQRIGCLERPGDLDGDRRVDLDDYRLAAPCLGGPGESIVPACEGTDLDGDGDADLADIALFEAGFTGP